MEALPPSLVVGLGSSFKATSFYFPPPQPNSRQLRIQVSPPCTAPFPPFSAADWAFGGKGGDTCAEKRVEF